MRRLAASLVGIALWLGSGSIARAQIAACAAPSSAEVRSTTELVAGARGWLEVRYDPTTRAWAPVRTLGMPLHHAYHLEWIDAAARPELSSAGDRTLRFSFVVVDRRLEPSQHRGVLVDARYRLRIESICAP